MITLNLQNAVLLGTTRATFAAQAFAERDQIVRWQRNTTNYRHGFAAASLGLQFDTNNTFRTHRGLGIGRMCCLALT